MKLLNYHQFLNEEADDTLNDKMQLYYNALVDLGFFNIRKVKHYQHIICTQDFKYEIEKHENTFELFEDDDHLGNWINMEINGKNSMEIGNLNDLLFRLANNIVFKKGDKIYIFTTDKLWKILIEKDPSYKIECPVEYLKEIDPNSSIAKAKTTGVFDKD